MEQKRQSDTFIEDLHSQIRKLSLEIGECKKFCDEKSSFIDGLQQLEQHNDELLTKSATYEKEIDQLKHENKKLSLELQSSQQCLDQYEHNRNEAVELNERLKEDLHRAKQLPRNCHRCADVSTLSSSTTKHLQHLESLLEQKTSEQKKTLDVAKAKHMEMQRARRAASEDRRRLNNENYQLSNAVKELESKLAQANANVDKKNKETNQFKSKLHEAKQIETELTTELALRTDSICFLNAEKSKLSIEVDELSSKLVNTQTAYNLFECSMINDLNTSRKEKDDHILAIKTGEQTIQAISRENNALTKKNESLAKELSEMRKETCRHRERIATLEGRESVLADMLKVNQDELSDIKDQMHKLTGIITDTDAELAAAKKTNLYLKQKGAEKTIDYQNVNKKFTEFKDKYNLLHSDYELLKEDYLDLSKIKEKAVLALETASEWQAEQKEREKSVNIKFAKQNEHIKTLLEDRENLLLKISEMHKDSIIHRSEMRNFIPESDTTPSSRPSQSNKMYYHPVTHSFHSRIVRYRSDPTLDQSDDKIMKRLRHTVRSMHRMRKFWQNGIDSAFRLNI